VCLPDTVDTEGAQPRGCTSSATPAPGSGEWIGFTDWTQIAGLAVTMSAAPRHARNSQVLRSTITIASAK
jgi:hypothetical protein